MTRFLRQPVVAQSRRSHSGVDQINSIRRLCVHFVSQVKNQKAGLWEVPAYRFPCSVTARKNNENERGGATVPTD